MNTDRSRAACFALLVAEVMVMMLMPRLLLQWEETRYAEQARYDREFWDLVDHDA